MGPNQFCADSLLNCGSEVLIEFDVNNANMDAIQIVAYVDLYFDGQPDYTLADSAIIHLDTTFQLAFELEQGEHQVIIAVEDASGNIDTAYYLVETGVDCTTPPVPAVINGMALDLFQMSPESTIVYYIDLSPDDLIVDYTSDDDFCNNGELVYSINLQGESPSVSDSILRLDCADYLQGSTQVIEVNAWDEAGNRNSYQTYVLLFDNGGCGSNPYGEISGDIYTESGEGLTGVNVMISNTQGQQITTDEGGYAYLSAAAFYDYTVQPKYEADPLNGVSTLDILLISQHILGIAPLDSPYKLLAADINGSESITTLDIIILRKLILGSIQDFPIGDSWHVVDADYVFPNPTNPWQDNYPTSVTIYDLPYSGISDIDFVAIKMGDINLNADPDLE